MARKPTTGNGRSGDKRSKKAVSNRARSRSKSAEPAMGAGGGEEDARIEYVSISQETRRRYLNYALSVIQSRALPDVRDGLKPVQRRILYAMHHDLHLTATAKPRKSMKICGDTTGNYHPHGETAVYEALVRMAQDFTLRYPLVNGQGNFGSVMGMGAAAARYTEARLTAIAEQLMSELRFRTVDTRLNYDATRAEPVVLPARFPNLLVNGTQGIAVGMATSIPPHNLGEVIKACVHLVDNPKATPGKLMSYIKGPDFPLGGRIVSDKKSLRTAYKTGKGSIKVRGEWKSESVRRKNSPGRLVIHSVPYGVATDTLKAEIGELIADRKLPQLTDLVDETSSESGLRIVLETKADADPDAVMAYLFKHTPLEQNVSYNATALVPDGDGGLAPRRVSLGEMLNHFNQFRYATTRRRFEFQLEQLRKRIHILEGFEILFDGLDKALKLIRASTGKADAAKKLMKAFPLDEIQTNAILELQLYRISRLEINEIREELEQKRAEADQIEALLRSPKKVWGVVKNELRQVASEFADKRKTSLGSVSEIVEFDAQTYIVRENTNVVVTRDGWIKRVSRLSKIESTRVREGDSVLSVVPGSTLDSAIILASDGTAYTLPIDSVPVSSGYGEPLSKHVKLGDGVQMITAMGTDPRFVPQDTTVRGEATPGPYLLIVTAGGQVLRYSFGAFRTPSTRSGRRYCRLNSGDRVAFAQLVTTGQTLFIVSREARLVHFAIDDVPVLAGPGKGVRGIKLDAGDEVIGARQLSRPSDALRVRNTNDKVISFGQTKYTITSRGGRGVKTSKRTGFTELIAPEIELVDWSEYEDE
ncbi:MAG: DNA topoisomerase IV subunit A [Planctomycetota bacterium]|nr:DNA topoisomerase IV subunit A [Planctomycetota bacterium]